MTLLLHTSTRTARLGLADGNRLVARDEFPVDTQCAAVLAEKVRALVATLNSQLVSAKAAAEVGLSTPKRPVALGALRALNSVVVHAGPGGFTSLRIGVTTANALAYALGIPIVGVTGDVQDLADLLAKAATAQPAPQNLVVPVYSRPPDIGRVPA